MSKVTMRYIAPICEHDREASVVTKQEVLDIHVVDGNVELSNDYMLFNLSKEAVEMMYNSLNISLNKQ